MRKLLIFALIAAMLLPVFSATAHAAEVQTTVEYLGDGSYIIVEIQESTTRMATKVGGKTWNYYDANDVLQWKMTITGEFLYDGVSSSCTYSTGTVTIYNTDSLYLISENAYYSGNTAHYNVTLGRKVLGITTSTHSYALSLSCDEDGNLS